MSDMDMAGDNNDMIVNEILREMNGEMSQTGIPSNGSPVSGMGNPMISSNTNEQYLLDQQNQIQRQMDGVANMSASDQIPLGGVPSLMRTEPRKVNVYASDRESGSMMSNILSEIKRPLVVLLLVYLIFNPMVYSKYITWLPNLFASDSSGLRHLRVFVLGGIVSILYYIITKLF